MSTPRSRLSLLCTALVLLVQGCVCGAPEPVERPAVEAPRPRPTTRRAMEQANTVSWVREKVRTMERETLRRDREARRKEEQLRKEITALRARHTAATTDAERKRARADMEARERQLKLIRTSRDRARSRERSRVEDLRLRRRRSGR